MSDKTLDFIISGETGSLFGDIGQVLAHALLERAGGDFQAVHEGNSSGVGGAEAGARAARDGYTLLMCNKGAMTSHPHTAKTYAPSDFVPLCQVAEAPIAVAVRAGSPYLSLDELLEASRQGGEVSYSTPNPFHTQRLALEDFARREETSFRYVQLPGSNETAIKNLIEGTVDFAFLAAHNLVQARRAGDIRILAVAHPTRLGFLPEDPTFAELGHELVTAIWLGLFTPSGAPADRIAHLTALAAKVAADPEVQQRIAELQMVPAYLDAAAFTGKVQADVAFHRDILTHLGAL